MSFCKKYRRLVKKKRRAVSILLTLLTVLGLFTAVPTL